MSLFGGSSFGGTSSFASPGPSIGATATQPPKTIDEPVTFQTKFDKLNEQWQNKLVEIHKAIQQEHATSEELKKYTAKPITELSQKYEVLAEMVSARDKVFSSYESQIASLKDANRCQLAHADRANRLLEVASSGNSLPSQYFWDLIDHMEEAMQQYRQQIEEIDKFINADAYSTIGRRTTPEMLEEIVRGENDYLISVASQISELHDRVTDLRSRVIALLKAARSMHDRMLY